MALFASEPTLLETVVSYIYRCVILASLFSLAFLYYLLRTKAPRKDDPDEYNEKTTTNGFVVNGNVEVSRKEKELLTALLHELGEANALVGQQNGVERMGNGIKAPEDDDEGEEFPRRRHVIREVTVRKIVLPPETIYADAEMAAKLLAGDDEVNMRKDSGTGGPDFSAAVRNIREASKRLEDDMSPVRQGTEF